MTVVIEVPPSRPTRVRRPEGEPGGADALATSLFTASARFEEVADEADRLQVLGTWHGVAHDAYREQGHRIAGEHSAMARAVQRVGRAVTAYADTLRDLVREWEQQVDRKAALDERRRALLADIEASRDPGEGEVAALRERSVDLRADYAELVADHDLLQRRARENEDLLRHAFAAATSLDDALAAEAAVPPLAQAAMAQPGAPGTGATPTETKAWWDGLTDAEREAVVAAYPDLVGAADGLPAVARDEANRVLLADHLATLGAKLGDGTISAEEQRLLDNARATEVALAQVEGLRDPITDERVGGALWLYDPAAFDGDGRVAVAVGDLDTAADVAVFTPGITTEMVDVADYALQMGNLYEATRFTGDGSSVAAMFWLGYDTPSGPTDVATMTESRAEDGGERLADALDGLRASRAEEPAHLTAIGHSYGSTTTSYAAGDFDLAADDVVLIGSPGAGPADHADDFSVGEDRVYVGRDSRDLVGFLGDEGWVGKGGLGLGTDPSSRDFGATRFEAENVDRGWHPGVGEAHSSYLDHDTESLWNIAQVVDGQGDRVNEAEHSYDPWYSEPEDPEWVRDPTSDDPGRSDTEDE
ncbi:alpha/beta hydrolase [Nocardioides sp. GCM10027113]|uniref:alpha/beta hydrolase n=1 Tax=unclassified Nocardioides TaxID=2615069 RepID=UPI0036222741